MKAVQVSHQSGRTGQTLFATSFVASLLIHGLAIGWMLGSSGSARSLLSAAPSFQMVSLVDAPEVEPQAIAEPAAIPEAMSAATVQNVAPEAVVPPPQAKKAAKIPAASVESPTPVPRPVPVEEPEKPAVVETQVKKPAPAKAAVKKPTPTKTSVSKPTPAAPRVAVVQAEAVPAPALKTAVRPKPASRNSAQAAARAQEAIAAIRQAQARAQGTSTMQARGGIVSRMQNIQMQAYYGRVKTRISNAWSLPMMQQTAQALQAVALLVIDREGQVIRYQLLRSSGHQPFDASLKRAVQASSPLPPLPETFPQEILEFELHFTPPVSS